MEDKIICKYNNMHIHYELYITFYFKSQHLSYIHNILRSNFNPYIILYYIIYYSVFENNKYQ